MAEPTVWGGFDSIL